MEKTSSAYIPSLDGMRGLSILLVFIAHIGFEHLVPGGLGVTIFFFISGYIITNLLLDEYHKTDTIDLKLFYFRRLLRLYPPLLLMIGLFFITTIIFSSDPRLHEVTALLLYYENYYFFYHSINDHSSLMVLWSLAVEEHFYLIFPFVFMLLYRRPKALLLTLIALTLVPLALRFQGIMMYRNNQDLADAYTYLLTHTRFDSIIYGCLASVVQYISSAKNYQKLLSNKWLFALALIVQLGCLGFRNADFRNTLRYSLQGLSLFILVPAIVNSVSYSGIKAFFANKAIVYIGKLSYSIYLTHMLAVNSLMFIKNNGHNMLYMVAVTMLTMLLSMTSYYLVEKPLGRLRKKLKPKKQTEFVSETMPNLSAAGINLPDGA